VDFDEVCEIYDTIGPDFLNKSVLPGERYTAVFIGPPGENTFSSFTRLINISDQSREFARHLNYFLSDAYAMLIKGDIKSESLRLSAEAAGMYKQGKPRTAVITNETVQKYQDGIHAIQDVTASFYIGKLEVFDKLLRSTTAGRQGVPPANMMLNLFRYTRKLVVKELYSCGFLTDTIPEEGTLTVFYENDIELIRRLLL
jgi:hypothetical protein